MFTALFIACGLGSYAAGGRILWTPVLLIMGVLIDRNRRRQTSV
ncbi:hypothetical protein [Corynebacterium kalidii]